MKRKSYGLISTAVTSIKCYLKVNRLHMLKTLELLTDHCKVSRIFKIFHFQLRAPLALAWRHWAHSLRHSHVLRINTLAQWTPGRKPLDFALPYLQLRNKQLDAQHRMVSARPAALQVARQVTEEGRLVVKNSLWASEQNRKSPRGGTWRSLKSSWKMDLRK